MNNYFLIHGSFGSPFSNWLPWLYSEIEKLKPASQEEPICYTPQMPTGVGYQNYENWKMTLLSYVKAGLIDGNTIIFAHSIAPVFVCKFLIKNKIKVKRLVFVCGFNNYLGINQAYDEVNHTMYLETIEDVKNYADEIICFYSDNDPYVRFEAEKDFADKIATENVVINGGGHLNAESGYTKFEELKKYL